MLALLLEPARTFLLCLDFAKGLSSLVPWLVYTAMLGPLTCMRTVLTGSLASVFATQDWWWVNQSVL